MYNINANNDKVKTKRPITANIPSTPIVNNIHPHPTSGSESGIPVISKLSFIT